MRTRECKPPGHESKKIQRDFPSDDARIVKIMHNTRVARDMA